MIIHFPLVDDHGVPGVCTGIKHVYIYADMAGCRLTVTQYFIDVHCAQDDYFTGQIYYFQILQFLPFSAMKTPCHLGHWLEYNTVLLLHEKRKISWFSATWSTMANASCQLQSPSLLITCGSISVLDFWPLMFIDVFIALHAWHHGVNILEYVDKYYKTYYDACTFL